MGQRALQQNFVFRLVGASALAGGAALITHILAGVALSVALVFAYGLVALCFTTLLLRVPSLTRHLLVRSMRVGLVAGVLATLVYDLTKFALSQLDPSPYDPFEALRRFGLAILGEPAPPWGVYSVGTMFHLVNGLSFGVAFCLFFGRRGVGAGIAWGLLLELFQLVLYPGWLDIRFYQEFVQVSAFAHIAYGGVLGAACRRGLCTASKD